MIYNALKCFFRRTEISQAAEEQGDNKHLSERAKNEINEIRLSLNRYADVMPNTLYGNDPERLIRYYAEERILSYLHIVDLLNLHSVDLQNKMVADIGSFLPVFLKILRDEFKVSSTRAYELNKEIIQISPYYCPEIETCNFDYFENINKSYDAIFCTQVLEHLVKPVEAFKSVLDGLTTGGMAFVAVPDGRIDTSDAGDVSSDNKSYTGHVNFWSPESWFHFVKSCADEERYEFKVNEYEFDNNYAILWKK